MDKVVYLDRDGTLNKEVEYLHRPEDLILLPGVEDALFMLKRHGFKLVVVTNQAGVARGYYTEEDVVALHQYLNGQLEKRGASIEHFFYCPHHPVHGIGAYKTACHCRKPETGMFEMAEAYYQVDKAHSYMIGDKLLDVKAGQNYGVKSILVGTGYGSEIKKTIEPGREAEAFDYYAEDLTGAAKWILLQEGELIDDND